MNNTETNNCRCNGNGMCEITNPCNSTKKMKRMIFFPTNVRIVFRLYSSASIA